MKFALTNSPVRDDASTFWLSSVTKKAEAVFQTKESAMTFETWEEVSDFRKENNLSWLFIRELP